MGAAGFFSTGRPTLHKQLPTLRRYAIERRGGCKEDYLLILLVDDSNSGGGDGGGGGGDSSSSGAVAITATTVTSGGGCGGSIDCREREERGQKRKGRMPFISSGLVGSHVVGAAPCDTSITGQPACNVGPTSYLNVLASCVCFCREHQPCTVRFLLPPLPSSPPPLLLLLPSLLLPPPSSPLPTTTTSTIIPATVTTTITTTTTTTTVLLSSSSTPYLPTYVLVPPCCMTGYIRDRHCIPMDSNIFIITGLNVQLTTSGHNFTSL
ncbi:hypothetical protein V1477_002305 [Vespula maculifrons]|uniref:Uncharacterized protein n=1 Tax=Vespula maculifrons TaxID=7453 RepID=A0ABD2CXL3_VESMC